MTSNAPMPTEVTELVTRAKAGDRAAFDEIVNVGQMVVDPPIAEHREAPARHPPE